MPEDKPNQDQDVAAHLLRAVSGPLTSMGRDPAVGTRTTAGDRVTVRGYPEQRRPGGFIDD